MDAPEVNQRRMEEIPVDVRGTVDDDDLDDHLWLRLAARVGEDVDAIAALSADVAAYYATRFFEWEYASGGVTGFLDWGAELGPLVAPGYRRMGLETAGDAFDALWSSPMVQRLIANPTYEPTEAESAALDSLADAVGRHDAERIEFVRGHPDVFSV